jgi:hypothetical protein
MPEERLAAASSKFRQQQVSSASSRVSIKPRQHCISAARLLGLPPLRSICAALTTQLVSGGGPHRPHRSQSPQLEVKINEA